MDSTCTTSRSSRRTAARCASTRSTPADRIRRATAVRRLLAREERDGLRSPERYAHFAEDVKESKRALLELLIDLRRDGQADRRIRRARQGQHAPQLLRHPNRPPRLHGRPQPVQARTLHARDAHPDPPARADRRDAARLRRSSCRGTSSTRSRPSSRTSPSGAAS